MNASSLSPPAKLALALEILRTYVRVRWLLRRGDVPGALERLRRGAAAAEPADDSAASRRRLGRAVARTLRPLPTDTRCLTQSLVLVGVLARRGIDATVVIGVRTSPEFEAHAWVESGSVPLLPTHGPAFEALTEL